MKFGATKASSTPARWIRTCAACAKNSVKPGTRLKPFGVSVIGCGKISVNDLASSVRDYCIDNGSYVDRVAQMDRAVAAGGGARDRNRARRAAADISDSRRRRGSTYRVTPGKDFSGLNAAQQADRKTRIRDADNFLCNARRIAGGRFQPSSDSD